MFAERSGWEGKGKGRGRGRGVRMGRGKVRCGAVAGV